MDILSWLILGVTLFTFSYACYVMCHGYDLLRDEVGAAARAVYLGEAELRVVYLTSDDNSDV